MGRERKGGEKKKKRKKNGWKSRDEKRKGKKMSLYFVRNDLKRGRARGSTPQDLEIIFHASWMENNDDHWTISSSRMS